MHKTDGCDKPNTNEEKEKEVVFVNENRRIHEQHIEKCLPRRWMRRIGCKRRE